MPMMAQTPTPPPTNVAAAAAVAANASAIPLSPGRMPVATSSFIAVTAIAAAPAATNASAITMSPGRMPVAAIGLNIGGKNPNITFSKWAVDSRTQAILPVCNPPPNLTWASVPVRLAGSVPPTWAAPVPPPN